ncbi:DNA internalization-related competence protein ComEC/Rec2 [Corallincola holothuriorum]|uniref:DNA internalization-related competence protein ComEC/Rec2 n=1 Tax=Corallincola holothuriorum TaxID=2282215 RepID=A0A368NRY6_9GAMM|nr:DNA internalization-related competence protein ComEC/Rec2 [Corallincola holothuriorum]RCU52585.1 DNA internalization-related competence protein ComEC/Rec2 [Corallincola holothuriorum]
MQSIFIGFLIGAITAAQSPWVVDPVWFSCSILLLPWCRQKWCRTCLALLAGVTWLCLFNANYAANILPDELAGQDITTTSEIISLPRRIDDGWRFMVRLKAYESSDSIGYPFAPPIWQGKVKLNWYHTELTPKLGDVWQWRVRLKPPVGFANDGGMDYEKYLVSQEVHAAGYIRGEIRQLTTATNYREQLRAKISALVQSLSHKDLILALTLGDRSLISSDRWQLLSVTGTSHLIAISGLHIGLIFLLAHKLLTAVMGWVPYLSNRITVKVPLVICLALSVSGVYALLSGFALPAQRAWFGIAIWCALSCLHVRISRMTGLLALMALFVIVSPAVLYGASFWLSFGAVANIALLHWWWCRREGQAISRKIAELLVMQLGLSVMMMPLTLLQLGFVAPLTPISNLLVVPLITFVVVPLLLVSVVILLFSPVLAGSMFVFVDQILALFTWWLNWLSSGGLGTYILPIIVACLLFFAVILVAVNRRFWPLALCLASSPLLLSLRTVDPSRWQIEVFDVGQGLAVVIQQGDDVLLYDTGNRYKSGFVVAEHTVVPWLIQHNISRLTYLVLSHDDTDHVGGAEAVLSKMDVGTLISPTVGSHRDLSSEQLERVRCQAGQTLFFNELEINMLSPSLPLTRNKNDRSCVLHISDGRHSLMLTGDIERSAELEMLRNGVTLPSNVLLAPHHGSGSSSSLAWLTAVAPDYAVFSRGAYNRYRFPAEEVKERYHSLSVETLDTACSGQISIEVTTEGLSVAHYRQRTGVFSHAKWYQRLSGCRKAR